MTSPIKLTLSQAATKRALGLPLVLLSVVLFPGILLLSGCSSISNGPDGLALEPPRQDDLSTPLYIKHPIKDQKGQLQAVARYRVRARVLGVQHYYFDREHVYSPIDVALGWGPMSDKAVLKDIHISQSNRWYFWRTMTFPISRAEIDANSANTHLIAATPLVEKQLQRIKTGRFVRLEGYLVNVYDKTLEWHTSTSRLDTGNGACEILYVTSVMY